MEEENKNESPVEETYTELQEEIQALVSSVSQTIGTHDKLKDKNFGLFYQHGRLGYVDLDMFAKSMNVEELLKTKNNTEEKENIDKKEKE